MKESIERNLDLLQNIEAAIILVYRDDSTLLDMDAKDAVDTAFRRYQAELDDRRPSAVNLSGQALRVFEAIVENCEWRLGRLRSDDESMEVEKPVAVSRIVESLREIQKSIPFWTKRNGSRGYLNFVSEYVK